MINPEEITTARVGELPPSPFELTDNIPHEIGETLFRGTVQQLGDVIGDYLGAVSGSSYNNTVVSDGGTLPDTTFKEWLFVGKGIFHNIGGQPDIITTEELNILSSNGSYWSLAVEIPIDVELAGITQNIRSGYTQTTPSEDIVFNRFAEVIEIINQLNSSSILNSSSVSGLTVSEALNNLLSATGLPEQLDFEANGVDNFIDIETTKIVKSVFYGSVIQLTENWEQTGSVITFTFIPDAGAGYKNLTFI